MSDPLDLAGVDILHLRLDTDAAPTALGDAVRALQSAQRLLGSIADMIDERGAGTPGRHAPRARAFLRTVRLGPVDAGAPGDLAVLVPVEPSEADGLFPRPDGPFARQVTTALDQAVRTARDAARTAAGEADGSGFRLAAGLGVSGALCRALAAIAGEHALPFEVALGWSRTRPHPATEPIRFGPELLDPLRRGARELDRPEVLPDVVLRGRVTDLRLDPEQAYGTVGVRGHFASDPHRRIHQADVRLPLPAYHRALRAHTDVRPVEVRGSLELRRSRWLLHGESLTLVEEA